MSNMTQEELTVNGNDIEERKGEVIIQCQKQSNGVGRSISCGKSHDALKRSITAALKGFAIGSGLKGGLSLFSLLAKRRPKPTGRYCRLPF